MCQLRGAVTIAPRRPTTGPPIRISPAGLQGQFHLVREQCEEINARQVFNGIDADHGVPPALGGGLFKVQTDRAE